MTSERAGDSKQFIGVIYNGEFDPGSGRTLAAGLTHASRGRTALRGGETGGWVSNA